MFCKNCGNKLGYDDKICSVCGASVTPETTTHQEDKNDRETSAVDNIKTPLFDFKWSGQDVPGEENEGKREVKKEAKKEDTDFSWKEPEGSELVRKMREAVDPDEIAKTPTFAEKEKAEKAVTDEWYEPFSVKKTPDDDTLFKFKKKNEEFQELLDDEISKYGSNRRTPASDDATRKYSTDDFESMSGRTRPKEKTEKPVEKRKEFQEQLDKEVNQYNKYRQYQNPLASDDATKEYSVEDFSSELNRSDRTGKERKPRKPVKEEFRPIEKEEVSKTADEDSSYAALFGKDSAPAGTRRSRKQRDADDKEKRRPSKASKYTIDDIVQPESRYSQPSERRPVKEEFKPEDTRGTSKTAGESSEYGSIFKKDNTPTRKYRTPVENVENEKKSEEDYRYRASERSKPALRYSEPDSEPAQRRPAKPAKTERRSAKEEPNYGSLFGDDSTASRKHRPSSERRSLRDELKATETNDAKENTSYASLFDPENTPTRRKREQIGSPTRENFRSPRESDLDKKNDDDTIYDSSFENKSKRTRQYVAKISKDKLASRTPRDSGTEREPVREEVKPAETSRPSGGNNFGAAIIPPLNVNTPPVQEGSTPIPNVPVESAPTPNIPVSNTPAPEAPAPNAPVQNNTPAEAPKTEPVYSAPTKSAPVQEEVKPAATTPPAATTAPAPPAGTENIDTSFVSPLNDTTPAPQGSAPVQTGQNATEVPQYINEGKVEQKPAEQKIEPKPTEDEGGIIDTSFTSPFSTGEAQPAKPEAVNINESPSTPKNIEEDEFLKDLPSGDDSSSSFAAPIPPTPAAPKPADVKVGPETPSKPEEPKPIPPADNAQEKAPGTDDKQDKVIGPEIVNEPVVFPFEMDESEKKDKPKLILEVPKTKDETKPPQENMGNTANIPNMSNMGTPDPTQTAPIQVTKNPIEKVEVERDKKEKREGKLIKFLIIMIAVIVILLTGIMIMKIAPDSGIGTVLNNMTNNVFNPQATAVNQQTTMVAPSQDYAALIKSQQSVNKNIKELGYSSDIGYDGSAEYKIEGANESSPIENNFWKKGKKEDILYDKEAVKAVIGFNSSWVDYLNSGDKDVYDFVVKGSKAKSALDKDTLPKAGDKITFNKLRIGDIRQNGNKFYVWTKEDITIKSKDGKEKNSDIMQLYELEPVSNKLAIRTYYTL